LAHDLSDAVVVKLGGSIFHSRDSVIKDIVSLQAESRPMIVVHGGASVVTHWLERQNHTTSFFEGERITDEISLEMVTAVLAGLVNKEIVAAILNAGGRAMGISGVDGGLVQGKIRERRRGYAGSVVHINPEPLSVILSHGFVPVVAPVSLNAFERENGERVLLNINGDTVAGAIAAALKVEMLIFLTNVGGIYDETGHFLPEISPEQARLFLTQGIAHSGMIPKLKACLQAVSNGHTACSIIDGKPEHCLLREINIGKTGTCMYPEKGR